MGDLPFLLECMNQDYDPENVQWQWLLGRLSVLLKLIEEYPSGMWSSSVVAFGTGKVTNRI